MTQTDHPPAAEWLSLADITPWDDNPRDNDATIDQLCASIERFGFGAPLVVDAQGMILAGHSRYRAAQKLSLDKIPCRRLTHLDPVDARLYALADNKIAETSTWRGLEGVMADLAARGADLLTGVGFSQAEIDDLISGADVDIDIDDHTTKDDALPADEPTETPDSKFGTVYELGDHLLFCGDAFDKDIHAEIRERVEPMIMLTDPPYAIFGSSTGIASDICDDKMIRPFVRDIWAAAESVLPWFGVAFIFCDWRTWSSWFQAVKNSQFEPRNMVVWDKTDGGVGYHFQNCHELIFYGVKLPPPTARGKRPAGQEPVNRSNICRHHRVHSGTERVHNAQKPVALLCDLLEAVRAGPVVDFFGGSGSTMIAADKCGRRSAVVEFEPKYCDLIRRRWTKYATDLGIEPGPGALC